jgi:hypothetical protein
MTSTRSQQKDLPPDAGMELRDLLADPSLRNDTHLHSHPERWFEALDRLAHIFVQSPDRLLQELVEMAVEFCAADSSGISLEEPDGKNGLQFRWVAVAGKFRPYLNQTTPRPSSPCGICLDRGTAQRFRSSRQEFEGVVIEPVLDGILIPWNAGDTRGTIWAVSHSSSAAFDLDDYRLLSRLSDFVSVAVHHQRQEQQFREQQWDRAAAAKANELAHQINNPLQSLSNTLYLAERNPAQAAEFTKQARHELNALSGLVKALLNVSSARAR